MLHQPLGLQMKLSHHIYELRSEFEEDSAYFTFNNLPSRFIYNVNNDLVAALGGNSNDRAKWPGGKEALLGSPEPGHAPPASAPSPLIFH